MEDKQGIGIVVFFVLLHLVCCGIPLLLLSGVSLAFLAPQWPLIGGALAVLGLLGFFWYRRRRSSSTWLLDEACCQDALHTPEKRLASD